MIQLRNALNIHGLKSVLRFKMENNIQNIGNQEITLRSVIQFLIKYAKIVRQRWYVVALSCSLFSAYFLYEAFHAHWQYQANLTFMLNDTEKGGLGGIGSLLGQFGIGGGGVGEGNLDKIVELSRTSRILKTALFSKATIDGQADFFANHLIRASDLHEEWEKDTTGLPNFLFTRGEFESFNRLENHATNELLNLMNAKKDPIFQCGYAKLSTIFSMSLTSQNEELSIQLVRKIFENLSEFYVMKTTERERQTHDVLRAQKDSVYAVMRGKEVSAARFQDFNRGLILQSEKVKGDQMQKDAQIATLAYGEMLKQYAIADFALKNNTPFIQPIDMPTAPLERKKESKRKALMLGIGLGLLLSIGGIMIFHIVSKAAKEAMVHID
jgi:hypothetical protein